MKKRGSSRKSSSPDTPSLPSRSFSRDGLAALRRMLDAALYELEYSDDTRDARDKVIGAFHVLSRGLSGLIQKGEDECPAEIVGDLIDLVECVNATAPKNDILRREAWLQSKWPVVTRFPWMDSRQEIKGLLSSIGFGGGHRKGKRPANVHVGPGRFVRDLVFFGTVEINGIRHHAPWTLPFSSGSTESLLSPLSSDELGAFLDDVIAWLKSVVPDAEALNDPPFMRVVYDLARRNSASKSVKHDPSSLFWIELKKDLRGAIKRQPALYG